jgi:hypothetical protein
MAYVNGTDSPQMKQLKASVPDYLQEQLELAASASGSSLSEEIRRRLEDSFKVDGLRLEDRALIAAVAKLIGLVRVQTGHEWNQHPGSHRTLCDAIATKLARLKPEGDPVFGPDELPKSRLVAPGSDDPKTMGVALEAMVFHPPEISLEQLFEMLQKPRWGFQQGEKDKKS